MAAIFFASSMPGQNVPLPDFVASDKLAHFCVYALLGLAIGYRPRLAAALQKQAVNPEGPRLSARQINVGILIGCLYALSDEWHQSFVPGRQAGWDDWVADALGVAFGIAFAARLRGKVGREKNHSAGKSEVPGTSLSENAKARD